MSFYVDILASGRNGTLYIGMTDDLARRIEQHRAAAVPSFTKRYGATILVRGARDARVGDYARARRQEVATQLERSH